MSQPCVSASVFKAPDGGWVFQRDCELPGGDVWSPLTAFSCVLPVGRRLLEQVVSCGGLLPGAGQLEEQTVTWFQFHSYLQRHSVSDLEKHFAQLTKEGRGRGGQQVASEPHSGKGASVRGALCPHAWKPVSPNQRPLQLLLGEPDFHSSR